MADIEQRVKEIIVNQLNVKESEITPEASFIDDLGADSLDTVQLIMTFEEEFKDEINGEIPESEAEKLTTVGKVIDYIKEHSQKEEAKNSASNNNRHENNGYDGCLSDGVGIIAVLFVVFSRIFHFPRPVFWTISITLVVLWVFIENSKKK